MPSFNERLKMLKTQRLVTTEQLCDLLDVKRRVLFYYESGERTPTLPGLIKLADFFDVSLDYLVGRSDSPDRT